MIDINYCRWTLFSITNLPVLFFKFNAFSCHVDLTTLCAHGHVCQPFITSFDSAVFTCNYFSIFSSFHVLSKNFLIILYASLLIASRGSKELLSFWGVTVLLCSMGISFKFRMIIFVMNFSILQSSYLLIWRIQKVLWRSRSIVILQNFDSVPFHSTSANVDCIVLDKHVYKCVCFGVVKLFRIENWRAPEWMYTCVLLQGELDALFIKQKI